MWQGKPWLLVLYYNYKKYTTVEFQKKICNILDNIFGLIVSCL